MPRASITLTVALLLSGCVSTSIDSTDAGQCRRDPAVGTGDAGACLAARAFLSCSFTTETEICLSDSEVCPDDGQGLDGGTCTDKCTADEYAIDCELGGIFGPPGEPPPAACRAVFPTPDGPVFFCCPCL